MGPGKVPSESRGRGCVHGVFAPWGRGQRGGPVGKRVSAHHSEVLDLDKPCKTIICAYTFQPRLYVCLQTPTKKYIRCLVSKELAQIQGFPRDHPFIGNTNSVTKQIGNAVPAKIIELLTKSILESEEAS
jgi:site-specific DNA-cytosine methylase